MPLNQLRSSGAVVIQLIKINEVDSLHVGPWKALQKLCSMGSGVLNQGNIEISKLLVH